MNIMVFNVPAETVGALSILNEFYDEIKANNSDINWIFVLSKPELVETSNIKVLRFPWVKKSWIHRIFFDNFIAANLVEKYNVNTVISFQNVTIPHINVDQVLYVHNSLPFVDYKFTLKENRHLWIYQNVLSKKIFRSIKKASKVIVQTEWMKKECVVKTGINDEKIKIISPSINSKIEKEFIPNDSSLTTFFYPASEFIYKNHQVVIEACKILKNNGYSDYEVIFTLEGDENTHISNIYNEAKEFQLPIKFVGSLSRDKVFELYTTSILLFPSYIETFGLPMLEARMHNGIIIASDCPFSHEILDKYENVYFFNPFNVAELYDIFSGFLSGGLCYKIPGERYNVEDKYNWKELLIDLNSI